jgi:chemotaxis protein CheD
MNRVNAVPVGIAEMKVGRAPDILVTYGLGSCVGIVVYDPAAAVGALAHILLPAPRGDDPSSSPAKFSSTAVGFMVEELTSKEGCVRERLVAKLAGGAHMFDTILASSRAGIGERNVLAAREALVRCGIPLLAEETGGDFGRTIEFDPGTGELRVRSLKGESKTI